MTHQTIRLTSLPDGIDLGALTQIQDQSARNFVIDTKQGRFVGFILRRGESVLGYVDQCPMRFCPWRTNWMIILPKIKATLSATGTALYFG